MAGASAFGRSTRRPACTIGAVTMKMIRSTSITSTSGVTLISLIGPPPPLLLENDIAAYFRMCRRTMLRKSLPKMSISVEMTRKRRTK